MVVVIVTVDVCAQVSVLLSGREHVKLYPRLPFSTMLRQAFEVT